MSAILTIKVIGSLLFKVGVYCPYYLRSMTHQCPYHTAVVIRPVACLMMWYLSSSAASVQGGLLGLPE